MKLISELITVSQISHEFLNIKLWGVVTHVSDNFNNCLIKPSLESGNGCVTETTETTD